MDSFVDSAGQEILLTANLLLDMLFDFLVGNSIHWKTRKQNFVTKSSTYAEYIALSEATTEIVFVINLPETFSIDVKNKVKIYEDNSGALAIAKLRNLTKD